MREAKKIKDRLLVIEDWMEGRKEPEGILENMNFLLDAIRKDKEQFQMMREQQAAERNTMNLCGKFLEENKLMKKWEKFFEAEQKKKQKEVEEGTIKTLDEPEIKTV